MSNEPALALQLADLVETCERMSKAVLEIADVAGVAVTHEIGFRGVANLAEHLVEEVTILRAENLHVGTHGTSWTCLCGEPVIALPYVGCPYDTPLAEEPHALGERGQTAVK